jgi:Neuraminidase (sialidase)
MLASLLLISILGWDNSVAVVCSDGGNGGYEAFPDVCRLMDGRLMCVFYDSYAHVGLPNKEHPKGGRISYVTSDDEGFTWSKPSVLYDGEFDDRDPSVVQLSDGRILCNFFTLKPGTNGKEYEGLGTWYVESKDNAATWGAPKQIIADAYCSSPIRVLSTGRMILGLYRETKESAHGGVTFSDDGGKTWSPMIDIPNGGRRLDAETDLVERNDGKLLAVQRADKGADMAYSFSSDKGQTWTVSKSIGFPGHCPYLLRGPGDIFVLAHRIPGVSLHYSLDQGNTWNRNIEVDKHTGAYPSMVTRNDDSILIVFYEEGAGSNILARRFDLSPTGLVWLPMK